MTETNRESESLEWQDDTLEGAISMRTAIAETIVPRTAGQALFMASDEEMNFPKPVGLRNRQFTLQGLLEGCQITREDDDKTIFAKLEATIKRVGDKNIDLNDIARDFSGWPAFSVIRREDQAGQHRANPAKPDARYLYNPEREKGWYAPQIQNFYNSQLIGQIEAIMQWLERPQA